MALLSLGVVSSSVTSPESSSTISDRRGPPKRFLQSSSSPQIRSYTAESFSSSFRKRASSCVRSASSSLSSLAARDVNRDKVRARTARACASDKAFNPDTPPDINRFLASSGEADLRTAATTSSAAACANTKPSTMCKRAAARASSYDARLRTQSNRNRIHRSSALLSVNRTGAFLSGSSTPFSSLIQSTATRFAGNDACSRVDLNKFASTVSG
mmetsp:Transcript_23398/g.61073  ORF Transcript_23398/g.61073 Transcript_23398/m.61073 type:complete len:214 (-) Transcript_23398:1290-1931(-)